MKRVLKIFLWSLPVIFVGSVALAAWAWTGHGLDVQQFQRIRPGMRQVEVQALMGKPSVAHSESGVGLFWIYNQNLKLCRGIVFLDSAGTVQSAFHDH